MLAEPIVKDPSSFFTNGTLINMSSFFYGISMGILMFNLFTKGKFVMSAFKKIRDFMFESPINFIFAAIFFICFMFIVKLIMAYTEMLNPVVSPVTTHEIRYEILSRDKFFERYTYDQNTENLIEETIISSTHSYNSEDKKAIIISGPIGNNKFILAKYIASSYYEEYILIDIRNLLSMSTRVLRNTLNEIVTRGKNNNCFVIFNNGGNLILLDKQQIINMNMKGKKKSITHRKKKNKLQEEDSGSKIAAFIATALSVLGDGDVPFIIINDTDEKFVSDKMEKSWLRRAKFINIKNPDIDSIKKILLKLTEKMTFNCCEEYLNEVLDVYSKKLQGCSYKKIQILISEIKNNYNKFTSIIDINDFVKSLDLQVKNMRNTLKEEKIHLLQSCTKYKPKLTD